MKEELIKKYIMSIDFTNENWSISKIKEDKQAKYKSKLESFNHLSGEFKSMSHNPLQVSKDNYLWFTFNQKLLEEQIIASGNYATLFLTLTLPSKFHKYSQQTKKYNPFL